MKILHLSDLHLGKRLNEFSLIEDQKYVLLTETINKIKENNIDLLILAGDIYDKSIASIEAISLFEEFLKILVSLKVKVLIIAGNHDSSIRLSFGANFMNDAGIYIAKEYSGSLEKVSFNDEYGKINFYFLPFVRPNLVREYFEEEIKNYNEAVFRIIEKEKINTNERNILLAHQFITSANLSGSEEIFSVGGIDNVEANIFKDFDYVALGHIHKPQTIKTKYNNIIRYCGTLLKYSLSEINDKKSITYIDFKDKDSLYFKELEIKSLRDIKSVEESYENLVKNKNLLNTNDYFEFILNDEEEIYQAYANLKRIYPNIMKFSYKKIKGKEFFNSDLEENKEENIYSLFEKFYYEQNEENLSDKQKKILEDILENLENE